MRVARTAPYFVWIERGILLLAVLYLSLHTLPHAWKQLNTDFPNYYLTAKLVDEHTDMARAQEWVWLQRQKDLHAIPLPLIALVPITPFSTLILYPFTGLEPLTAKHVWIIGNLLLLIPIAWFLRRLTELSYTRIALALALSLPLHRNLVDGQFYILLLLLIVAALWSYVEGHDATAGALVGLAAACKIFPAVLFILFWKRRAWKTLVSGLLACALCVALALAVFGTQIHHVYLHEVLPATLRGEALPPYATASGSITTLMHYLFLSDPEWNPHPWHASVMAYSVLLPLVQMLIMAPVVLLLASRGESRSIAILEWCALLTTAVTVSTIPASYNFVLIVLPLCVLAARAIAQQRCRWLFVILLAFAVIGVPFPSAGPGHGLSILFFMPRLPTMMAATVAIASLLWREREGSARFWTLENRAFACLFLLIAGLTMMRTFNLETLARTEMAYRLPAVHAMGYLRSSPQSSDGKLRYIAMMPAGYRLVTEDGVSRTWSEAGTDDLSFAVNGNDVWVERAQARQSVIVRQSDVRPLVTGAHDPAFSATSGAVYLRDHLGRGQLWLAGSSQPLTPESLNVYEAAFHSRDLYAVSAVQSGGIPALYLKSSDSALTMLPVGEARYPAISPDGKWLVYSRFEEGFWNLWLRDLSNGATQRITELPCNQIQPSWEQDSKHIVYGSDCGRALWFTAVSRRQIVP
ncbi:glycosyltransferase 87 family protein [Terriglobus albidus]|uniref:glycosyltransferase 87 family protein n=1 Tax=Terriglobus albidus TaxID=1592106 RepID=UPI0021DF6FB9|nr:glycosyltransferase 87 family protein [Terriglobus albidus]